ncbi:MAG: PQQ-binding-like beta-propeller repeat protein [Pirellulales bacterium]
MAGFHQSLTSTQLARRWWSAAQLAGCVVACWGVLIVGSVGRGPAAQAQVPSANISPTRVSASDPAAPLILVVMDPLAAPLSCPCVKGYAQRDYAKLGDYLSERLERTVVVKFGESLAKGLAEVEGGRADIVIGKRSVVLSDAAALKQPVTPVADLTGKDGGVVQRGLIVVRSADAAKTVADLKEYRILLGPADSAEKHSAARELLAAHGVVVPKDCPISAACSDGASEVVEAVGDAKVAAVISSYARPLLEGCGTIKKGDLRVVGETRDVPFVSAFIADRLDASLKDQIRSALLDVRTQPLLRLALESKAGFVPIGAGPRPVDNGDWPGWRGAGRDAQVAYLPDQLPTQFQPLWKKTLFQQGLGGPAVAQGIAVVGDRDTADESDVFQAVDASTGERRWSLRYPASGRLDYGNSPRATPLITNEYVYLLGAFGHLHCVRKDNGKIVWKKHLRQEYQAADDLVWGVCSSPLIVDGKLIVNPGGPQASLVALDPATGELLWKSPGGPAAFASFVVFERGGRKQVAGYDKLSCGGWDVATGERLWTLKPRVPGDFNVPTPLVLEDRLLLTSENNGVRLIGFTPQGEPEERAYYGACGPDMHTPVRAGDRLFAVHKNKIHCLSATDLKLLWSAADRSLAGHVSLAASGDRVLAQTQAGELLLIDARADRLSILSRLSLFSDEVSLYAHPALVGDRLYVRGPNHLVCIRLPTLSF